MTQHSNGLQRLTGSAPPWAVSIAFHGLALLILGMVTWAVAVSPSPDHLLTLQTVPQAGADEQGVDDPAAGGARAAEALPVPAARPAAAVRMAPAPQTPALDASLAEIAPAPASTASAGGSDRMADLIAALSTASQKAGGASGGGGPGDLLQGTSAGFGTYIGKLRGSGLDIVLVLDATNSMAPYIEQARKRLHDILDVVTGLVPNARFGVVAYKDYGDEYGMEAVKATPLTADVPSIRKAIDDISAGGGGDIPEPIHEALKAATDLKGMKWQMGRKHVVILVGDSPVHASGRAAAFAQARQFVKKSHGTINVIDVGGTGDQGALRKTVQADLRKIAREGAGSAFLLQDADVFWRYLIMSIFGERFKNDIEIIIRKFVTDDDK